MSKDKINQEPKLEELSSDDLEQVQGGKAARGGPLKKSTIIAPTPKNLERVHEDE